MLQKRILVLIDIRHPSAFNISSCLLEKYRLTDGVGWGWTRRTALWPILKSVPPKTAYIYSWNGARFEKNARRF